MFTNISPTSKYWYFAAVSAYIKLIEWYHTTIWGSLDNTGVAELISWRETTKKPQYNYVSLATFYVEFMSVYE